MEALISRYRNLTVLLLLIFGQLILLAYQVRTSGDVRLLRVWVVSGVMPFARLMESARASTKSFTGDVFEMREVRQENLKLKEELGQLKVAQQLLENRLQESERAKALEIFQKQTPSRTLAASIIGTGTGVNSRVLYLDRGSRDGVEKGMAVIVPDGIVGKIVASYPNASMLMLITEETSVASVISQKSRVRGMLRGGGSSTLTVKDLSNLQKVEDGEWFLTSGEDRIFPKGFRAGQAKLVRDGTVTRGVELIPSGLQSALESVLIVIGGVHTEIPPPDTPASTEVSILPPPPTEEGAVPAEPVAPQGAPSTTEADRLVQKYRRIGEAQNHQYGTTVGRAPDFNRPLPAAPKPAEPPKPDAAKPPEKQ